MRVDDMMIFLSLISGPTIGPYASNQPTLSREHLATVKLPAADETAWRAWRLAALARGCFAT